MGAGGNRWQNKNWSGRHKAPVSDALMRAPKPKKTLIELVRPTGVATTAVPGANPEP